MDFYRQMKTRDGRELVLRSGRREDGAAFMAYFLQAHGETDYLTTYPDETTRSAESEGDCLEALRENPREAEVCAFVDGVLVGSAGISLLRDRDKTRHRAEFGISVLKAFWGKGIGTALTKACIALAGEAGYLQLELEAVAENESALSLYRKCGFAEFGRNPRAFRTREGRWQELVLMRLEL